MITYPEEHRENAIMRIIDKKSIDIPKVLIPNNTVLTGFRGSISHNTYKPSIVSSIDDIDIVSIYIAPVDYYIGLDQDPIYKRGKQIYENEFDSVVYELRHFTKLCLRSNPNIIPLLWLNEDHYLNKETPGEILIANRDCFSSKLAYKSFTGYANSQLEKVSKKEFKGYMGIKRKALVEKFGYDCVSASHTIRLFKMGIEFLETGELNVYRQEDSDLFLDIKHGKWKLSDIKELAKNLYEDAKIALVKSDLPEEPDNTTINELFREIISDYIYEKYQVPQALKCY